MGQHSSGGKPERRVGGSSGRRVPAERRRSPGERSTSSGVHDLGDSYRLSGASARRRGPLEAAPARLHVELERRRAKRKRIALVALASLLGLLVLSAVGVFAYVKSIERTMHGTAAQAKVLQKALTKAEPMEPFNALILGVDHRPGELQYRTDTMMLVRIDPETKQVWMLSIPRDTRAELPGHGVYKINQAHFFDGPEGSIKAVEGLTGLKVNHYLEMNFSGFKKAVDALGGVWVDVPEAIDDIKADSSPYHRARVVPKGYQLLDGEHALTFVRARHQFVDQDFTRMANQQLFMRALADQVAKAQNITRIPKVVSAVAPYLTTDMSLMQMIRTAQALTSAGGDKVYTATVKGEWKSPFIYTDTELLNKLVGDLKAGRSFDSTAPAEADSKATTTKKPSQVSVTVRNGSGVSGVATQAAAILKAAGFPVREVGNANQMVYDTTLVVYKDEEGAAELVLSSLPAGAKTVASRGMYSFTTDILVVVGKNWDATKAPAGTSQN